MRGKLAWNFGPVPVTADNLVVMIGTGEYFPAHSVGGTVYNDVNGFVSPIPVSDITAWVQDAKLHDAAVGAYLDYMKQKKGGER